MILEHLLDLAMPLALACEAGSELVRLAELEADVLRRASQRRVRHPLWPQREDARLIAGQTGAPARGEQSQRDFDAAALFVDDAVAAPLARALREPHDAVHHVEVLTVVEQTAVAVGLGVDTQPEPDIRLDSGRTRQAVVGPGRGCRKRDEQAENEQSGEPVHEIPDRQHRRAN